MDNLNNVIEAWARELVVATVREEMAKQIPTGVSDSDVLQRLDTIDTTMDIITSSVDGMESEVYDLSCRLDDVDGQFGDIESDKVSCDDLHSVVMDILNEVQLSVVASPIVR